MPPPLSLALKRHWQRLRPGTGCALCGAWLAAGLPLCEGCDSELPWLGPHCRCCALPLPVDGLLCGGCLAKPLAFDQVLAPWRYAFPVDTLINRFKHRDQGSLGRLAGALLARHLQHLFDEGQPRPALLLPVPSPRCACANAVSTRPRCWPAGSAGACNCRWIAACWSSTASRA
ncbi:putative amidophosphoribosyltransferase [Pseudomonas sp. AS2.8]|nr:putative amidophosphoribosyltransferase [Pseudomonas sp. AS2.8]